MLRTAAGLLLALATPVWALDFVSVQRPAILYGAPSAAAEKVGVISAGYPLEKLVAAAGWAKVRDDAGKLAWIEESALADQRTLLVTAAVAQAMESPADDAPTSFRAAQGVILELLPGPGNGWARVRHASGKQGYVRIRDVWGL